MVEVLEEPPSSHLGSEYHRYKWKVCAHQEPSMDNSSSQENLLKNKIMDNLEVLMPQKWQAEMTYHHFGIIV
eukprot:7510593-Ditylum_brightwellii.AAC.1